MRAEAPEFVPLAAVVVEEPSNLCWASVVIDKQSLFPTMEPVTQRAGADIDVVLGALAVPSANTAFKVDARPRGAEVHDAHAGEGVDGGGIASLELDVASPPRAASVLVAEAAAEEAAGVPEVSLEAVLKSWPLFGDGVCVQTALGFPPVAAPSQGAVGKIAKPASGNRQRLKVVNKLAAEIEARDKALHDEKAALQARLELVRAGRDAAGK